MIFEYCLCCSNAEMNIFAEINIQLKLTKKLTNEKDHTFDCRIGHWSC